MPSFKSKSLSLVSWWILYGVFCNCAGWTLSAFHQLNPAGYAAVFTLGVAAAWWFRGRLPRLAGIRKWRRRFRRPFPLAFLILAAMAILGGVLWAPANPDGLTQRIPRVLHWLAEQRWHWIEHAAASLNTHACGFEWLMAPMFALLKTDRVVFLYNGIAYLLMPGLVFSVFHRLGVRPRVAWHWMWLTPAGLCFAMQAGSIANDAAGALLALAAVDFALRARSSAGLSDLWLSLLSASLLSGIKTSNLALGLPWFVAVWPSLRRLFRRPLASGMVLAIALASSLLPVMILIHRHGGGWLGLALEVGARPSPSPALALAVNAMNLALDNFQPPLFPFADWWNAHAYHWLPGPLLDRMVSTFEPGAAYLQVMDLQFEVFAGLGLGISLLLLVSWLWVRYGGARTPRCPRWRSHTALVRWSAVVSLLVFASVMSVASPARLVTPYYCLLMPLLLGGAGHQWVVRRRWWKGLAFAAFTACAVMLVLNPARPLFPARTVFTRLSARHPHSRILARAALLYQSYAVRWDLLAPVRAHLPPDARNIAFAAFISGSPMETSLWRPFGHRRLWPMDPGQTGEELTRQGIRYAVVAVDEYHPLRLAWLKDWVRNSHATILAEVPIRTLATGEPWPWYVIKLP